MIDENNKGTLSQEGRPIIFSISKTEEGYQCSAIARDTLITKGENGNIVYNLKNEEQPGDVSIKFDKKKIEHLYTCGKINQELYKVLIGIFDRQEEIIKLSTLVNKNIKNEELEKFHQLLQRDHSDEVQAVRYLLSTPDSLTENRERVSERFYCKKIDSTTAFGANRIYLDRITYLPELLEESELKQSKWTNGYYVTSKINMGKVGEIGLEYDLRLGSYKDPNDAYDAYLDKMRGGALKTYLAYWAYACDLGLFIPPMAPLTDIMNVTIDSQEHEKKIYFTCPQKRVFWQNTILLQDTKFTFSFQNQKRKWVTVKRPFLEILDTACDKNKDKGYPDEVRPCILDTEIFNTHPNLINQVTKISKGTLALPPTDIMLAVSLQVRAGQRRNESTFTYDLSYLLKRAGLEGTVCSNPREANKLLKEKLDRIQKAHGVSSYEKLTGRYRFEKS